RTSTIQGIEQHVSMFTVVMPNDEFPGRVINDDGVSPLPQLVQELGNQHRFTGSGVAHYQEVEGFILPAQTDNFFVGTASDDSDSVSVPCLVELRDGKNLWTSDVLALTSLDNVGS